MLQAVFGRLEQMKAPSISLNVLVGGDSPSVSSPESTVIGRREESKMFYDHPALRLSELLPTKLAQWASRGEIRRVRIARRMAVLGLFMMVIYFVGTLLAVLHFRQ